MSRAYEHFERERRGLIDRGASFEGVSVDRDYSAYQTPQLICLSIGGVEAEINLEFWRENRRQGERWADGEPSLFRSLEQKRETLQGSTNLVSLAHSKIRP